MSTLAELFVDIVARDKTSDAFRRINDESKRMIAGMSAIGREALAVRQIISGMSTAGFAAANPFGAFPSGGAAQAVSAMMKKMAAPAASVAMLAGMGAAGQQAAFIAANPFGAYPTQSGGSSAVSAMMQKMAGPTTTAALIAGMTAAGQLASNPFGMYPQTGGPAGPVSAMMQRMSQTGTSANLIAGMSQSGQQAEFEKQWADFIRVNTALDQATAHQEELDALEQARGMKRSVALREELGIIQDIVAKRRLSLDAGGSAQGMALAGQMHRMDEIATWRKSIVEQGRFAGNLAEIGKRLEPLRTLGAISAATGMGAIAGLTAAASPHIWDTFTGSVRLLSSEIGRGLLPSVISFIGWLQRAATWFRGLDDSTKTAIGRFIVVGTAIGAVVVTLGTFGHMIWLASTGLARLAAMSGVASAAQGTTGAAAAGGAGLAAGGAVGASSMAGPAAAVALAIGGTLWMIRDQLRWNRLAAWVNSGQQGPPPDDLPMGFSHTQQQGQQGNQLLSNFRFQPQMGGIEEAWRSVQMASLGLSPVEQRLLRNHLEAMSVWSEIAENTAPDQLGNVPGGAG